MEYLYVMIYGYDWEDIIILANKEEAIELSKKHPTARIEIFSKKNNNLSSNNGYLPTYNYYKNGEYFQTNYFEINNYDILR